MDADFVAWYCYNCQMLYVCKQHWYLFSHVFFLLFFLHSHSALSFYFSLCVVIFAARIKRYYVILGIAMQSKQKPLKKCSFITFNSTKWNFSLSFLTINFKYEHSMDVCVYVFSIWSMASYLFPSIYLLLFNFFELCGHSFCSTILSLLSFFLLMVVLFCVLFHIYLLVIHVPFAWICMCVCVFFFKVSTSSIFEAYTQFLLKALSQCFLT